MEQLKPDVEHALVKTTQLRAELSGFLDPGKGMGNGLAQALERPAAVGRIRSQAEINNLWNGYVAPPGQVCVGSPGKPPFEVQVYTKYQQRFA